MKAKKTNRTANEGLWLLTIVYPRAGSAVVTGALERAGINAAFLFYAHGTATDDLIRLLGLAQTPMEVAYAFLSPAMKERLFPILKPVLSLKGQGIAFTTPVSALVGKSFYPFVAGHQL